jgi:hypothetical protein
MSTSSSSDESLERSAAIEKKMDNNQKIGRKKSSSSDSSAFSFVHCSPGSMQDTLSTIDVVEDIDFKLLRDTEKLSFFSTGEGNVVCAPILERSVEGDVSIIANKIDDDDNQNIPFMVATSSGTLSVLPSHNASNDDWGINSKQAMSKSAPTTPTRNNVVRMNSSDSNMKRSPPRNPFDAFGEYVVKLFQQAVLHEEELEMQETVRRRRQSQLNIKWLDDPSTPIINDTTTMNTAVGGNKTNKEIGVDLSTPRLEALAAVQAVSGFQNLSEVKKQLTAERTIQQSLHPVDVEHNTIQANETTVQAPTEMPAEIEAVTKEWEKQWEQFVHEKDKIKLTEVMIQVCCVSILVPL